ncbi:MAG: succinylglutamate desuccinylase/aspartoacylase family protein [Gammaproteobacteria bacterium]|nr:succinylglutamate desuccinylase/aspartoacylase family protein [Gammaproteobacteria bacterium]
MARQLAGPACLALLIVSSAVAADRSCGNKQFTIDARFDAGNFHRCKFKSADLVEITIRREDKRVTVEQPWYAFYVTVAKPATLKIRLRFPDAYARYWPKLSTDREKWSRAAEQSVQISADRRSLELRLDVDKDGVWVSAQELLTAEYYAEWLAELDQHPGIETQVIGHSTQGRPLVLARSPVRTEAILLLGRQHPAEVPGAMAMREFVKAVLADTELARRFRDRFMLLIVPHMNPDGVANGHWRHNAGRTDLNRDWGPFTQPETRAVGKLLKSLELLGIRPRLMLDFHATKQTETMIFYTQTPEDNTDPALFAGNWLTAVQNRIPDYSFRHDPRKAIAQANTKNFFFRRYGIPAITYELGDSIDRDDLREHTPVFAEEMMRVMLAD